MEIDKKLKFLFAKVILQKSMTNELLEKYHTHTIHMKEEDKDIFK